MYINILYTLDFSYQNILKIHADINVENVSPSVITKNDYSIEFVVSSVNDRLMSTSSLILIGAQNRMILCYNPISNASSISINNSSTSVYT